MSAFSVRAPSEDTGHNPTNHQRRVIYVHRHQNNITVCQNIKDGLL